MMSLVSDINFAYFFYNKQSYTSGTVVKISKDYQDTHTFNEKPIWKYACFSHRFIKDYKEYYSFVFYDAVYFELSGSEYSKYCGIFTITSEDLENAIEGIIKPIPVELIPVIPKKDWEVDEMWGLWLIYVAVLLFSLIFREFYLIWVAASFIFFNTRKELLNK